MAAAIIAKAAPKRLQQFTKCHRNAFSVNDEKVLRQLSFKPIPRILLTGIIHLSYHLLCRFIDTALLWFHKNSSY
jgi:hypothetical protein